MFRVTALCVLVSVGVIAILPRAASGAGGSRAATETATPSALFADVRVPAEVVPVSIGRPIGSIAGSTFDAQVCLSMHVPTLKVVALKVQGEEQGLANRGGM